jgi:hypothetical protein
MTFLEHIAREYPAAARQLQWAEAYAQRRRSGGTHRAAVMFANSLDAEHAQLPVAPFEYDDRGVRTLA